MNNFYLALKQKIAELEVDGTYVPTNALSRFPRLESQYYEPDGFVWFAKSPIYARDAKSYLKNAVAKCKPLDSFYDVTDTDKQIAHF